MKELIEQILQSQIDFSIFPPGGPTAAGVAEVIANAIIEKGYDWGTSLGGPSEWAKLSGNE